MKQRHMKLFGPAAQALRRVELEIERRMERNDFQGLPPSADLGRAKRTRRAGRDMRSSSPSSTRP